MSVLTTARNIAALIVVSLRRQLQWRHLQTVTVRGRDDSTVAVMSFLLFLRQHNNS